MAKVGTKKWRLPTVAAGVLCAGLLYLENWLLGCPIKLFTGVSCAGCGMTRAWLQVLRLDFRQAFYYHPLFALPPVALAMLWQRSRIPPKLFKGCMYTMMAAFLVVYVYRLCMGDGDVVVFAPRSGVVFRVISYLRGGN